jgi:hypothetical protein
LAAPASAIPVNTSVNVKSAATAAVRKRLERARRVGSLTSTLSPS